MRPIILFLTAAAILSLGACGESSQPAPEAPRAEQPTPAKFVGSEACRTCHESPYRDWQGSHHELAMQDADDEAVLGAFSGATLEYYGTTTTFLEDDRGYVIRTQDRDGNQQDFTVTHTFGVEPLQQYLVDFPGGRKQVPAFAWDTRAASAGGQRWYHLYPDEFIAPDDPLHWTGRYFTWNYMCAECHSTRLEMGYDIDSNAFETTYSEVSVGCEACHGPGADHVAQARMGNAANESGLAVDLDDRANASWVMNVDTGIAERSRPADRQQQPEACGRCHARRGVIAPVYEYGTSLSDTHMVSLLEEQLYHADGRIQDEVYVYGSFVQSRMYAAGVTCSDCHNPHSGQLKTGPEPNEVCSQCHLPAKFASPAHGGADASNCVDCHMQATTYMGVDDRRDHSFRLPNTASDESHYGAAISAGRTGAANDLLLRSLSNPEFPAIARATMLTLLAPQANEALLTAFQAAIDDPDPLVRIAALRALRFQPAEVRMQQGSQLLHDAVRGVRVEAALTYAEYRDLLPSRDARAFASAADDYRSAMLAAANMPESATNLAEFESRTGNPANAERYFRHAIRVDPTFAGARHAYGLYLVRAGRSDDALAELRLAAELEPESSRYVYVLGVALNSLGLADEALDVMQEARNDFPDDFDIAWGLATMLRDSGDNAAALAVARELAEQFPDDPNGAALVDSLQEGH